MNSNSVVSSNEIRFVYLSPMPHLNKAASVWKNDGSLELVLYGIINTSEYLVALGQYCTVSPQGRRQFTYTVVD